MADTTIVNRAIVTAPKDYQVPQAQEFILKTVRATIDGTSAAGPFLPALQLISPAGDVQWTAVPTSTVAAGASVDTSWFRGVTARPQAVTSNAGVTLEQFLVDSTSSGVNSTTVLVSGTKYLITVQGTYSIYNAVLGFGTPEAEAMFPDSHAGRVSTQVGRDADTVFADEFAGNFPGHQSQWEINLGSGFSHIEPDGGPYAAPQSNHLYRYTVTGQGSVAGFMVNDSPLTDNYGKLQVTIASLTGSSGGGGGGSLLPPSGADYTILSELAGVPFWTTFDGGSA